MAPAAEDLSVSNQKAQILQIVLFVRMSAAEEISVLNQTVGLSNLVQIASGQIVPV